MPAESKIAKGYVKTVNTIWLVTIALAVGFTGGVVFSAYRGSSLVPMTGQPEGAAPSLSAQEQAALRSLIQRTQADPKDLEAWTQLGHIYFDNGQHAMAIDAYEQALSLDSGRPDVWTDLGVMYRRAGDPSKAVSSFERAIAIDPGHRIALFNKGVVLMHDLRDTQGALAAWETLVRIDPEAKTPSGQSVKELIEELKKGSAS